VGGDPFFFVFVIILIAVDEEDDVGVLLDGAGLAEVGELGLVGGAPLHGTGALGNGQHRGVNLAGQGLERPGDEADLLHAVLAATAAFALHQLEIVQDNHVDAALVVEAEGLGAHLRDADHRGIVDIDGGLREDGPVASMTRLSSSSVLCSPKRMRRR
jgi:hypothetical protein